MSTEYKPEVAYGTQSRDSEGPEHLAFFDQYRSLLFSIAYRMLGSVADAEDMLQEAFIRWQGTATSEIRSPRAFLVTIVSRLCLNHLESARLRREEYIGQWLPEPRVTSFPTTSGEMVRDEDSLSMAFLLLLERLTAVERAVFLLREVFEYDYSEISAILDQSEANCRQVLSRARRHIKEIRPRFRTSPRQQTEWVKNFLRAAEDGDIAGLLAVLSKDVELHTDGGGKGIAAPNVVRGAERVARGAAGAVENLVPREVVRIIASVAGAPGIVSYYPSGRPFSTIAFNFCDEGICGIYVVTNPDKLRHIPRMPLRQ